MELPGMTSKIYDEVWEDLRKAGQATPKGLIHHIGVPTENGILVNDVWESAEHFNEFGKTLMPIMEKHNVPQVKPTILPIHYQYIAK